MIVESNNNRRARRRPTALFVAIRTFALANSRLLIMRTLLSKGWRVVAAGNADEHAQQLVDAGVELRKLPFARGGLSPHRDISALRSLSRLYDELKPDLTHHFHAKPIILGGLAASRRRSGKVVNTVTGLGHAFIAGGFAHQLSKIGYRKALGTSDLTIFLNPDDQRLFIRTGLSPKEKTALVAGSGVDLQKFRLVLDDERRHQGGRDQKDERNQPPRVLMLTRLLWEKGVGEFVEAAKICKRHFPAARFQIAGEFYSEHPNAVSPAQVEAWVKEGAVEFLGYLDNVERELPGVSMVVLPSYREGVPRTLLEASACGIPTVATNVAGCREAVQDGVTGLLVPPRDSESLAQAMMNLLKDGERRKSLGAAGRKLVEAKFDLREISRRTLELYKRVGVDIDINIDSTANQRAA